MRLIGTSTEGIIPTTNSLKLATDVNDMITGEVRSVQICFDYLIKLPFQTLLRYKNINMCEGNGWSMYLKVILYQRQTKFQDFSMESRNSWNTEVCF